MRIVSALVLVVGLIAAACTTAEDDDGAPTLGRANPTVLDAPSTGSTADDADGSTTTTPSTSLTFHTVPLDRGAPAGNRLVVLDENGTLRTMDPDGANLAEIARSADVVVSEPGFSPDGTRIVWSELRAPRDDGTMPETFLLTANVDGSDPVATQTPFLSFYSQWDPTASRAAVIGNAADGVGLAMAELGVGPSLATPVNTGRPYFIAWGPDGDGLLARVGNAVTLVDPNGEVALLAPVTANFRVPIWSPDNAFIFPESNGVTQELARFDLDDGQTREPLGTYAGQLVTVLDPTGERLATQVLPLAADEGPDDLANGAPGDVVVASLRIGAVQSSPMLDEGLSVIDLATGDVRPVAGSDEDVIAFFWSPDGERLLILANAPADERSPDGADLPGQLRPDGRLTWSLWVDGAQRVELDSFVPSDGSVQSLVFFDQYATSHTFWSPDSTSFVYTGTGDDGRSGVWVRQIDAGPAVLVADGGLARWSPT